MSASRRVTRPHPIAIFYLLLSLALTVPVGLGALIADAGGDRFGSGYATAPWLAVGASTLLMLWMVHAASRLVRARPVFTSGVAQIVAGVAAAACPAVARALLPWEEPGTGMGSPLATLISIVLLLVPAAGFFVCMVIVVAMLDQPRKGLDWLEHDQIDDAISAEDENTTSSVAKPD